MNRQPRLQSKLGRADLSRGQEKQRVQEAANRGNFRKEGRSVEIWPACGADELLAVGRKASIQDSPPARGTIEASESARALSSTLSTSDRLWIACGACELLLIRRKASLQSSPPSKAS